MQTRKSTSIKVVLYTSKTLANGEHPLMLRVIKNRKIKYVSLGFSCSRDLWDFNKNCPKTKHPNKELIEKIIAVKTTEYQTKILELKADRKEHTAGTLIEKVEKPTKNVSVFDFFKDVIESFIASKKIGNSKVYSYNFGVLKKFRKNKDLSFSDIDTRMLNQIEKFLFENDFKETTISIFFRTFRAIYNKAIEENITRKDNYPFDKFKISKFDTETSKRSLTKADFQKIENLQLPIDSSLYESRMYFLFSYYGQGINFNDIAKLKYDNLRENRIEYKRAKTGQRITFNLLQPAKEIIEFSRTLTGYDTDNYIFTILDKNTHITPKQIDNRIHKVITRVNRDLKEIGKLAGIETPITTYVARHTFATVLKRSGVSTDIISEAMAHRNPNVTQIYLNSFENDVIDNAMENLL